MGLLETYFSKEEIVMLDAITATQVSSELSNGDPYSAGMKAWVQGLEFMDPERKNLALEVAGKIEALDAEMKMRRELIERWLLKHANQ